MSIWGIVCSRARNVATLWTVPLEIRTSMLVMTQHWAGYTPSKHNYWWSPFHIILGLHLQKYIFLFYSLNSYLFFSSSMLFFFLFMSFLTNITPCSEFKQKSLTDGWMNMSRLTTTATWQSESRMWKHVHVGTVRWLTATIRKTIRTSRIWKLQSKKVWRSMPCVGHWHYVLYERITSTIEFSIPPPFHGCSPKYI